MTRERRASLVHGGGMRFTGETGTGRRLEFGIQADAGEQSPVEMVTAAVAACSAMDVVSILEKKRQPPDGYRVEVVAIQRDPYPQVLTRIDLLHDVVGGAVTEVGLRRAIGLSALKYCPVNAMLSAGETEIHHGFRLRATADGPVVAEGEVVVTGPYRRPDVVA